MRLFSYRDETGPHVGVRVAEDQYAPLPFATMLDLIGAGEAGLDRAREAAQRGPRAALGGIAFLAPIPEPRRNLFCLGWNYAEHSREAAQARGKAAQKLPERPVFFTKATTTVLAPGGLIPCHAGITAQLDWEVELGVVLGLRGTDIPRHKAMAHVFGYLILNDVSARDLQAGHGGQFFKGKSLDGTCPMGSYLVTADEVPDPHALRLTCRVNGELKQDGSTADMIFPIPVLLEWLSQGLTLLPGDIIATGTPAGVGFARTPPQYLQPGDVVECVIEGLGRLRNVVGPAEASRA